jgi:CubicO group peptidase (beta-lactamase class C family)
MRKRTCVTFRHLLRNHLQFLPILVLSFVPATKAQNLTSKIEQYMNAQMEVNHFRGAIFVAAQGKVLAKAWFPGGAQPLAAQDTRYPLGSIGKQFIALAILQLQDKGKLQLQDSACNYVAACPNAWKQIKIRDLLTQSDGIPDIERPIAFELTRSPVGIRDLLREIGPQPLGVAPGERVRYSYSGYQVLAAIIESVSGESLPEYLGQHIFSPLGMSETGYEDQAQARSSSQASPSITPDDLEMAAGYRWGRLHSTVEDLYRWDRALNDEGLLSKEWRRQMFTPHIDGYGFGWAILREFERIVQTQASGFYLFGSVIRRYPSDDACVIVLSDSETTDAGRISRDLAAMLFNKEYALAEKRSSVDMNPTLYAAYEGRYQVTPDFILMVRKNVNHLTIQAPGQAKVEIFPMSETRFFAKGLDTVVNFVTNSQGKATELVLQQGGRDIPAPRIQ